jgi:hypothetical protein
MIGISIILTGISIILTNTIKSEEIEHKTPIFQG